MNPSNPIGIAAGLAITVFCLSGCTQLTLPPASTATSSPTDIPSTSPATASLTPTPTASLDAEQSAAIEVAGAYEEALAKIRSNPAKYDQYKIIDLLRPLAFDDMIQAVLNGVRPWRDKGWHEEGSQQIVTRHAEPVSTNDGGSVQVTVTICKDQRDLVVVDRKGSKATAKDAQSPEFLVNTYDMRRGKNAKAFKVYEFGGEGVTGCAS